MVPTPCPHMVLARQLPPCPSHKNLNVSLKHFANATANADAATNANVDASGYATLLRYIPTVELKG